MNRMNKPSWDQIKAVFTEACELPAEQVPAFLDRACAGDAELRLEVESLLAAKVGKQVATGGAARELAAASTMRSAILTEGAGTIIGPYKLLQLIGEGGFGSVFLAEQTQPVRRRVAVKIIKLGMDTRQVIARFEAERQALALMDHPHIAKVLDGGATPLTERGGGRPYFVMEYVVGDAITAFADAHKLTIRDRLDLFQQVCSAVQHAHTKGIIHRDLKPGNVLVTMVDGKPFAKVIDFGIAKATAGPGGLTDKTLFTEHRQLIGTPEYMSPEQAEGSPDIDTRTDVYALGVLLYELLTGETPFDGARLRSAAYAEIQRIIKEEEPLSPSQRLSRSLNTLAATAAARQSEPDKLRASVHGELDWIVMRALDKERGRRYESASSLAHDVRRHLAGEAVVAAPVSKAYRLRKFVRKNRGPVVAVSAVMLALVAGGSVAAWQWTEARQANDILAEQNAAGRSALGRIVAEGLGGLDGHAFTNYISDPSGETFGITIRQNEAGEVIVEPASESFRENFDRGVMTMLSSWAIDAQATQRAQTEVAKETLSKLFIEGVERGGMPHGLPVIPEIRGMPGYKLLPYLDAGQTGSGSGNFKFGMMSPSNDNKNEPLPADKLLPALADSAIATLAKALETADAAEWNAYTANLALAQAAIDASDYPGARAFLAKLPQAKGGWERELLEHQAAVFQYSIRERFSTLGFSTSAKYAFSYGHDTELTPVLKIWNADDGMVTREFRWPAHMPGGLSFQQTDAGLVTSWSLSRRPAEASADAQVFFGLNNSGDLVVLDAEQNILLPPSGDSEFRDASIVINGASNTLLLGTREGSLVKWPLESPAASARFRISESPLTAIAHMPSSGRIVVGTETGEISLIEIMSGQVVATTRAHHGVVNGLAVSPDGQSVVSIGNDGSVRVWNSELSAIKTEYRIPQRRLRNVIVSEDSAWIAVGTEWEIRVLGLAEPQLRFVIPQYWGEGLNHAIPRFTRDGSGLLILNGYGPDGNSSQISLVNLDSEGGPIRRTDGWELVDRENQALVAPAILASSPNGPSGLAITTPDGTRRIVGGGDKTVRFYEAKDGKPTLPATAESPEGVYREVAVFRMPEAVTNLQMTGDGTRLIIHLEGGSARVWDIRDPEERRKDLQAEWAERVPAGAYLDAMWSTTNSDGSLAVPDDKLRDAVINDASLSPLRRLVAMEMLEERVEDDRLAVEQAFAAVTEDQTDKFAVLAAAAARTDLPKRVHAQLIAKAAEWDYKPAEPSESERFAEERKQRLLAETELSIKAIMFERGAERASDLERLRAGIAKLTELAGSNYRPRIDAIVRLAHSAHSLVDGRWERSVSDEAVAMLVDPARDDAYAASALALCHSLTASRSEEPQRSVSMAAAREAIVHAKSLMLPATDGTPSRWADDKGAAFLIAEAESLIGGAP
jgi:serine/threonine protein kinase/WD40 repeat protein